LKFKVNAKVETAKNWKVEFDEW